MHFCFVLFCYTNKFQIHTMLSIRFQDLCTGERKGTKEIQEIQEIQELLNVEWNKG